MQLTIGSQRMRNTDGVISVSGSRQICLEFGPVNSELLLTMNLYNAGGSHIARLRRNHWTFNDHDRFDFKTTVRGVQVVDTKLGQVALDARVWGADSVVITEGEFYTSKGTRIELTEVDWSDVFEPRIPSEPAEEQVEHQFSKEEFSSIRKAVGSSNDTLQCPICGCSLSRARAASGSEGDVVAVSCIMCRRNVVVDVGS